jgi:hypothetical protein
MKTEGETVIEESYNCPINADSLVDPAKSGSSEKGLSDSSEYSSNRSSKVILLENLAGEKSQMMIIEGTIDLPAFSGKRKIERATLIVEYWPDRKIINGYAEAFTEANIEGAKSFYYTDSSMSFPMTDNS